MQHAITCEQDEMEGPVEGLKLNFREKKREVKK
jgi:hypothetical protein